MSNIYVFTKNGFKQLIDVVRNKLPVYTVNSSLTASTTVVDHWNVVRPQYVYCVKNRDVNFASWFTDAHDILVTGENGCEVINGKVAIDRYGNGERLSFPTNFTVANGSTRSRTDVRLIEQQALNHRLSTGLLYYNRTDLAQFLYYWHRHYGSYYAHDYNQSMMIQALVTGTGMLSVTNRSNGFKIVPFNRNSVTIDSISSTSPKNINRIPYDQNGNQLHLIYNIDQRTCII